MATQSFRLLRAWNFMDGNIAESIDPSSSVDPKVLTEAHSAYVGTGCLNAL